LPHSFFHATKAPALSYFPPAVHQAILADPDAITGIYTEYRARFVADLGPGFALEPEDHIRLAFATVLAYDLKPYGACTVSDLEGMLAALALDCDNYVAVTWHLFNRLVPQPVTRFVAVGWDRGPFGNHAQIIAEKAGYGYMLADPTIGLVQCGYGFDWIASGKPCSAVYRKEFLWRPDPAIQSFRAKVVGALANGGYKPAHLLYVFSDLEKFSAPPPIETWPTPALIYR